MRSVIDPDPITWAQFVAGYDYSPDCVACLLVPPPAPGSRWDTGFFAFPYAVRVPDPRVTGGPTAPRAFGFLRFNYGGNGVEYQNPHEAKYLYKSDYPVWLIRRAPSGPPTSPAPRRPPLPMPSPNRPQRPPRKPQPKVVNPTPPPRDIPSEF